MTSPEAIARKLTKPMIAALATGYTNANSSRVLGHTNTVVALMSRGLVGRDHRWTALGREVAQIALAESCYRVYTLDELHEEATRGEAHASTAHYRIPSSRALAVCGAVYSTDRLVSEEPDVTCQTCKSLLAAARQRRQWQRAVISRKGVTIQQAKQAVRDGAHGEAMQEEERRTGMREPLRWKTVTSLGEE